PDAARAVTAVAEAAGATTGGADPPRLVVNATPLGLHGEALPDRFMRLSADQVALDLVYRHGSTPFLHAARRAGAAAHDGLGMLVAQAACSFERWTGLAAPVEAMTRAARAAIS
ncbi:MAG: shikimate dehydrogenase, partial [Actinomycetota bacterium]|nr:shikimate dehydrogenase [Actinomycetota bacterium]